MRKVLHEKYFSTIVVTLGMLLMITVNAVSQKSQQELMFTGIYGTDYLQIDSIKVSNSTRNTDTILYWPDTVLILDYMVGLNESLYEPVTFRLNQNHPNPVVDHTYFDLDIIREGKLIVLVHDLYGRITLSKKYQLTRGSHSFMFYPGKQLFYLLTAIHGGTSRTIKIFNASKAGGSVCRIDYQGNQRNPTSRKTGSSSAQFIYYLGDTLIIIGYHSSIASGLSDRPESDTIYHLQFASGVPCPETPTVTYEGNVYNSVQIFNQCWLKESLNSGQMIPTTQNMSNNNIIEKYCYENDPVNCSIYGALYQWDEAMKYVTEPGSQGICPEGWHIPLDDELSILEGSVDSQYGIGDAIWDSSGYRGYDSGFNLKSDTLWSQGNNGADLYGFRAMPSGLATSLGHFLLINEVAIIWSSNAASPTTSWYRSLTDSYQQSYRYSFGNMEGFQVRCIRD